MKKTYLPFIALFALVTACGGGDGTIESSENTDNTTTEGTQASGDASTSNYEVSLPDGVSTEDVDGDFDGKMVFAGDSSTTASMMNDESPAPRAYTGEYSATALSPRDVAGFFAERPAPTLGSGSQATTATEVVDQSAAELNAQVGSGTYTDFQEISRQTLSGDHIEFATFGLEASANPVTPTDVANDLVQLWGLNKDGGSVSNLPSSVSGEAQATDFTIQTGVFFGAQDRVFLVVAVVPTNVAGSYQGLVNVLTDPRNAVSRGSTVAPNTDSFTQSGGGSNLADFLFVVDNSGSMSNEQTNLSNAASKFSDVLGNSSLDYQLGVITTDSSSLVDNDFTDDTSVFQTRVNNLGTSGSATESGIFHAEEALSAGESVDNAGHPRSNATLSVIMLSDEPDQYMSYSGGPTFDASSNLFINESYTVHSIVDTDSSSSDYGQTYIDLANNTGGSRAPIATSDGSDLTESDFEQIMTTIAQKAGGTASRFQLSETPIPASISVSVEGSSVAKSSTDGWTFSSSSNSIVFHGSAVPAANESITVEYDYQTS